MRSTWKECEACDMHVPLLSVHCSHCRKCIYALDHHCYFLGHCIGRGNQRFFIVFCLYAALGSAIGEFLKSEMNDSVQPDGYVIANTYAFNVANSFFLFIGVYNLYEVMSKYRSFASREFTYYLFPFTSIWYLTGNTIYQIISTISNF